MIRVFVFLRFPCGAHAFDQPAGHLHFARIDADCFEITRGQIEVGRVPQLVTVAKRVHDDDVARPE